MWQKIGQALRKSAQALRQTAKTQSLQKQANQQKEVLDSKKVRDFLLFYGDRK